MQPTPQSLPLYLAPAETGPIPHTYVLHRHSQLCRNCATLHEWSAVYAKTHLRSRTGMGKYITNLRPVEKPEYNLPIEILIAAPGSIPFCLECVNAPDSNPLGHLPPPPKPERSACFAVAQDTEQAVKQPSRSALDLLGEL